MESLYRSILKQAWGIAKKYKFLWFFGVFALWLGNGGEMQIFFKTLDFVEESTTTNVFQALNNNFRFLNLFHSFHYNSVLTGLLFTLITIAFLLLVLWLIIISQTALVNATHKIFNKEKISFKEIFNLSTPYFLPVLGLNLISKILITFLVFVLLLPLLLIVVGLSSKFSLLLSLLIWVIFLPLATIISFVMKYAINFLVIKKDKFFDSIAKAWVLFKTNWLISIEMSIALLVINFLLGLVVVYVTIALVGPYYKIDVLTIEAFRNQAFGIVFFKTLPLVIMYVFVGSFLAVFQTVAWTLLFEKLVTGKRYSKLIRIIASLSNYMKLDNQITKVSDINNPRGVNIKRRPGRPKVRK